MLDRQDILALLASREIAFRLYEHTPVMTVAEARAVRGTLDGLLCKCLLLANAKGALWLLTVHADARPDLKQLARFLESGHLSFAPPERLADCLGCVPGAVSILGLANDTAHRVTAVIQESLLTDGADLHFHPLVNTATVGISSDGLLRFLGHTGHPPVRVAI